MDGEQVLAGAEPHAVVLVEGTSDRCALEALAERRGRDLDAEGEHARPLQRQPPR